VILQPGMARSLFAALAIAALALPPAACGDDAHPDPCDETACPLPAAPRCEGATLVVVGAAACTEVDGAARCDYATTRTDCGASGMGCAEGACHPVADAAPAAACAADAGPCDVIRIPPAE